MQQLTNVHFAKKFIGSLIPNSLILEHHCVLHGRQLLVRYKLGARAHHLAKRPIGDQRINNAAAKRFGSSLKRMQRDRPDRKSVV